MIESKKAKLDDLRSSTLRCEHEDGQNTLTMEQCQREIARLQGELDDAAGEHQQYITRLNRQLALLDDSLLKLHKRVYDTMDDSTTI